MQEPLLAFQATGIARQASMGTHYAVARHDDGHRIASYGLPHGLRRNGFHVSFRSELPGQFAVADGRAIGNGLQQLPHAALERRSVQAKRRKNAWALAPEVSIEPNAGLGEDGQVRLETRRRRKAFVVCRIFEQQVSECSSVAHQVKHSEWRRIEIVNIHFFSYLNNMAYKTTSLFRIASFFAFKNDPFF